MTQKSARYSSGKHCAVWRREDSTIYRRTPRSSALPILLYDDGVLRSSSDSLYDDLAPLGRFLRPDLELGLDLGNEVRASRSEALGGGRVLVGYRAVDASGGDRVVLAAPGARRRGGPRHATR